MSWFRLGLLILAVSPCACTTHPVGDDTMVIVAANPSANSVAAGYCQKFGKYAVFDGFDDIAATAHYWCLAPGQTIRH